MMIARLRANTSEDFSWSPSLLVSKRDQTLIGTAQFLMTIRERPDPTSPALVSFIPPGVTDATAAGTVTAPTSTPNADGITFTWSFAIAAPAAAVASLVGIVYFDLLYLQGAARHTAIRGTIDFQPT